MTGCAHSDRGIESENVAFGSVDAESARRIDAYLERAVAAENGSEKDFHVRHARQLLEACRDP